MKIQLLSFLPLILSVMHTTAKYTLSWSTLDAKLPDPVSDMSASVGRDGLIYIAGGCNAELGNVLNDAETGFACSSITDAFYSFNPTTYETTSLEPLPRPRYRHGAAISNNHLWLIGGRTVEDEVIMEIDIYNFETKAWSNPGNHSQDTSDNAAFAHPDDNAVYVAGGWNASYTARADVWRIDTNVLASIAIQAVAPLQEARGDIKAAVVVDDADGDDDEAYAYVAGGFTDQNFYCPALGTVEQYSFKDDKWAILPSKLASPRGDKSLVELDGDLFALGGEAPIDPTCQLDDVVPGDASVVMDDVEVWDDNVWQTVASIPDARFRSDAVSVQDKIFAFGGQGAYNKTCKCYRTSDQIVVVMPDDDDDNSGGASVNGMNIMAGMVMIMSIVMGF